MPHDPPSTIDDCESALKRFSRWLPGAIGLLCLAPFQGLLSPDERVVSDPWRDYAALHLPLREFAREELLAGRLPLWNPYFGCGQPLHAAQQASLCYPLITPLVLLFGANCGLKLSLLLHLALSYAGTVLLARRFEISRGGASYAALVATWSGGMLGHLAEGHVSVVAQVALAPWFMLALISLLADPGPLAACRLAVIAAIALFAGHPQILYYILLVGALWAAASLAKRPEVRPARARSVVAWLVVATITALLLSGVQLLPTLELLRDGLAESGRGTAVYGGTFAMDGADTGRLFLPYLNGNPFARWPQFVAFDQYHERVVYVGLAAPLLAAFSLTRVRVARWQWGAAWLMVLSLAIGFGESTPAFSVLARVVPGLCFFRCPGRVFCVTSLFLALLAGRGLEALTRGEHRAQVRGLLRFIAVAIAGALICGYAAIYHRPDTDWPTYLSVFREKFTEPLIASSLIIVDAVLLFAIAKSFRLRGAMVQGAFLVLTTADLGYFNVQCFRLEPPADRTIPTGLMAIDPPIRFVEARGFPHLDYNTLRYSRFVGAAVANHRSAVGTDDGGVLPGATARLYRAITANVQGALAAAACDYACAPSTGAWTKIDSALPRVRFAADQQADFLELPLEKIGEGEVERLRTSKARHGRVLSSAPRRLEVEVDALEPGWLVVADTYYPGWHCSVDGDSAPIEPVHSVFRRVRLLPGKHKITMSYEPQSALAGAWGTAVGLVMVGVLVAMDATNRRRTTSKAANTSIISAREAP